MLHQLSGCFLQLQSQPAGGPSLLCLLCWPFTGGDLLCPPGLIRPAWGFFPWLFPNLKRESFFWALPRVFQISKGFLPSLGGCVMWQGTQGVSTPGGAGLLSQGHLTTLQTFWLSSPRVREWYWHLVVEDRDAFKHPKTKNYLVQNVKSIEVKQL